MRRIGGVWETITSFQNLLSACQLAARGKRDVAAVARFLERREYELLRLQRELQDRSYRPGAGTTFLIRDPKQRWITASPFRDRVVHHALIDPLEDFFDRRMIAHSYACRRGKGQHAAIRYAQTLTRRYRYCLKLDVRHCFGSLRHDVVMETLGRVIKDRQALWLCERIVRGGCAADGSDGGDARADGCGLPIGHLTSQWFANLVLGRLDRFVTEQLRVPGYLRYMDDFVLFAEDKAELHRALVEVREYLAGIDLELKELATRLAPTRCGLPFLGLQIYPGLLRLRPRNKRRSLARLRRREWQHRCGRLTEDRLADCVRSMVGHLQIADTGGLRRVWFRPRERKPHDTLTGAGPDFPQPRQPRRQFQQRGAQRSLCEPQQQRADNPQQQPGVSSRQGVSCLISIAGDHPDRAALLMPRPESGSM